MKFRVAVLLLSLQALLGQPALAASPPVTAAETSLSISAGFAHTQYHENLVPGDDESGAIPGFGISLSALTATRRGYDVYTALNYDFDNGNLNYAGHNAAGQPANATDNATFNRVEARIGLGFPLAAGAEAIPYFALGVQTWNRNITAPNGGNTSEFYHSGLFGMGLKFDIPVDPTLVASASGEALALAGGGISGNNFSFNKGFGVTAQERIELGLDQAVNGRFHIFTKAYWEHFNYSGTGPEFYGNGGYIFEPLSTTTQFGLNAGIGFSFN